MFRFQSTPSARRATGVLSAVPYISGYFNPRPPRGGRPGLPRRHGRHPEISIHALREEGDRSGLFSSRSPYHFNPRPPRGGRPGKAHWCRQKRRISIHALREEGDPATRPAMPLHLQISIHALREEGDRHRPRPTLVKVISIHALREEGDSSRAAWGVGT